MSHLIKLTGYAKSDIRILDGYYSFDMEVKGSSPADGLPTPSTILYTVFINQSQLDTAGLNINDLNKHKLVIEGGICLDIPIDLCPGEIGVSCKKLSLAPAKEKPVKKASSMPEHDAIIPVRYIKLPDVLPNTFVPENVEKVKKFIELNGFIDKPVYVQFKAGWLMVFNSYAQYIAAKDVGLESVPVKFQKLSKKYVPEGTEDVMPVEDIIIPEEFLKFVPSKHKLDNVYRHFTDKGMIPSPVLVDKDSKILYDGYAKYYVMKELNIPYIPVKYQK